MISQIKVYLSSDSWVEKPNDFKYWIDDSTSNKMESSTPET